MACITCVLVWATLALIILKIYIKLTTGWCRSNRCLVGKTALITGSNKGIGYQTAEDFAKRGAKVILACRDPERGQDAVEKIIKATDNKNVVFKQLDVSSFGSVRQFAKEILASEERLDILVNNAGVSVGLKRVPENGAFLTVQTNHYGPFLLTTLLLDLLKKTPNARIVNVSSMAGRFCRNFDVNNLEAMPTVPLRKPFQVYARSKLCNILFTIELSTKLKGTGVTVYSVHPGVVLTDIFNNLPPIAKMIIIPVIDWFFKSPIEGAQSTIYCSVTKGIEDLSGEHFEDCHVVNRYKTVQDPDLPKQLWKVSEQFVKSKSD